MSQNSDDLRDLILLLPPNEAVDVNFVPEFSIVVPALNEEITIGEFVDWCWEGLKKAEIIGEIIIIDSSTDDTALIALSKGARVLRTPKRGLGQAYLDAIPFIRGNFIIMGDCDLTYDFRNIGDFIDSYRNGNDFIMGSRIAGSIEKNAMPLLHQYFGTPLTTWILNKIYHSKFSDIHCGMRGLTKNALIKMNLTSRGWEYASEMVLKAARLRLKIDEVPVNFYKDREGRLSHHKRAGFWSPWVAGWINLKVMMVYSPDTFLLKPSIVFMVFGILTSIILSFGAIQIGSFGFDIHWMLVGLSSSILGYALFQTSIFCIILHGLRSTKVLKLMTFITYDKGMILSILLITLGIMMDTVFIHGYLNSNFVAINYSHVAVLGLLLIVLGIQTFSFTLVLELIRRIKN